MKEETMNAKCDEHSGCLSDIGALKESDKEQWVAIRKIQERPPVWATAVISLLTFLLGCSLTWGIANRKDNKVSSTYIPTLLATIATSEDADEQSQRISAMTTNQFRLETNLPGSSTGTKIENLRSWTLKAISDKKNSIIAGLVGGKAKEVLPESTAETTTDGILVKPNGQYF
jgi:hypothetical protein